MNKLIKALLVLALSLTSISAMALPLAYVEGEPNHKISNENLVDELEAMVRDRVAKKQAAEKDIIATSK